VSATAVERQRLPRRTYTVAEAAALIGVSERDLRNQIASGTFPVRPLRGLGRRTVDRATYLGARPRRGVWEIPAVRADGQCAPSGL
jgi:hypothetical protein